eukprot:CAMPEP_0178911088 /NCGR_PEP_ID=MMETSP0786-20121207/9479_1 /TAXON_ID=186022 /ORGANISM="Thalassionema frauenfeldii, Strain CCMP 1798" /LENGTH=733 /DNA_ID=CAMNT_0020583453 /DNA_START=97 /DNA_END=2298 /DNA_ORIENTATION=-
MNGKSHSLGITYEHQSSLPRLPIPSLDDTLKKFLVTVQPLLSPAQLVRANKIVKDFQNRDGADLQKVLEEYDQVSSQTIGSYIEEFWNDSYLAPDTSVVLNLNPFFLFEDDPDAKVAKSQVNRASSLTFQSLKFAAALKNERIKPDDVKGTRLCMDQFRSLFGSCRIPKPNGEKDIVEVHTDSDHVLVLYRNQFYYFRALWPSKDGKVKVAVTEDGIQDILTSIVDDGKKINLAELSKDAIGVLTTLDRNKWALARKKLISHSEENKSALEMIDSALFVLVLDDFEPEDIHDAAANMLHGTHILKENRFDSNEENGLLASLEKLPQLSESYYQAGTCCNRWYDKLQIIVCSDGRAGINFEHSAIDGHTALRFASDIYAETVVTFAKSITKSIYTQGCPLPSIIDAEVSLDTTNGPSLDINPKKIVFDLPNDLKIDIHYAETSLGDAVKADDTHVLEFDKFGKSFIVGNKLSPDSLVQMSIILGYYRVYGEVVSAYEPVLTKRFFHGRTEAMRSTTMRAVSLCKIWTSHSSTEEAKLNALRESTKYHSMLVRESAAGRGVDRHLYALKCITEKNNLPMPEFFKSEAWRALNHTVLSTSNCGNPALSLFGFGPVVPDGFGIGYIIKDSSIQYSISSKHRQTKRFADAIHQTLLEIRALLKPLRSQSLGYHQNKNLRQVVTPDLGTHSGYDAFVGETSKVPETNYDRSPSFVGRAKLVRRSSSVRSTSSVNMEEYC